jgi:hypothetical protein
MSRLVVLFHPDGTNVLTDTAGVRVLVLDRDVEGADDTLKVGGAEVAVDALLGGIPKFKPERVAALYSTVWDQLADSVSETVATKPRVVVLLNGEAPPQLLVEVPDQVTMAVGRVTDAAPDDAAEVSQLEVWATELAPSRVAALFESVGGQLADIMGSPTLTAKDRVQLSYVARHWCGQEV